MASEKVIRDFAALVLVSAIEAGLELPDVIEALTIRWDEHMEPNVTWEGYDDGK